ncbi:MAG: hypothetical protein R3C59_10160 [Planctomycetaceae bacterium]
MGKFKPFLFGTLLGVGVTFVALQFHLVQSAEGFRLVPRTPQPSIGLAYADIRNWTAEQWADRPELARALVAHGSTDLVASSVSDGLIESISSEGSALDKLRGLMNDAADKSNGDSLFDPASPLTIPESQSPPVSDESGFQDLFSIPFPHDARKAKPEVNVGRKPNSVAGTDDFFSSDSTSVARRDLPSIDDVMGTTQPNPFRPSPTTSAPMTPAPTTSAPTTPAPTTSAPTTPAPTTSAPTTPAPTTSAPMTSAPTRSLSDPFAKAVKAISPSEETQAMEELLFGDAGDSPSVGPSSTSETTEQSGLFEDISGTVMKRTQDVLEKARTGVRNEASSVVNDAATSMNRYVLDRVQNSVPESISSMFQEEASTGAAVPFGTDETLPPALKAIQDGFDPFIR